MCTVINTKLTEAKSKNGENLTLIVLRILKLNNSVIIKIHKFSN